MVETKKNIKLEEKRVDLTSNSDDAKMLTLKAGDLGPDCASLPCKDVQALGGQVGGAGR